MVWYLKTEWHHDFADEPVVLYSEVGDDGYEVRKVQRFRDGRLEWADADRETDQTGLGELPIGPIGNIAAQAEFTPETISRQEFEAMWQQARGSSRSGQ